ncbi:MAG: cell wall-active antibiotics response protein [Bacteroidetes bacterium]|nr:cell wall-active antibiotics response protein [Bacteroidota bacterium]
MKRTFTSTLLLGCLLLPAAGISQSRMMKSADIDEETLLKSDIEIDYGVIRLMAGQKPVLFNLDATYDKHTLDPELDFRRFNDMAKMKFMTNSDGVNFDSSEEEDEENGRTRFKGKLELGPKVEHDIRFSIGAGSADLDLTNLNLTGLDLNSGAGSIKLAMRSLNQSEIKKCKIQSGVGEIKAFGVNNLNFSSLAIENGVGSVYLDFSGTSTGTKSVSVETGVGEVKIVLPPSVGVRIKDNSGFFSNLTVPPQYSQKGDYHMSPNYKSAKTVIEFDVSSGIGSIIFITSEK